MNRLGSQFDCWRLARRNRQVDWHYTTSTRQGITKLDLSQSAVRTRTQGEGDHALVFLCDPPNLVEHYDLLLEQFDPDQSVVVMEQPGFGFSFPKAGYEFSVVAHAAVVLEALRALPHKTYTLVAPCISTFSAMRVALLAPELVTSLVLMQASDLETTRKWSSRTAEKFVRLSTGVPRVGKYVSRIPIFSQIVSAMTERRFGEKTYPSVIFDPKGKEKLILELIEISNSMFNAGACNCMSSLVQTYLYGREDDFAGPLQPCIVLWGDSDLSHATSARDGLRKYVPHAEVQLIESTGHHLELENPRAISSLIKQFIDDM